MWQVDNDHYVLWRLEYDLRSRPVDNLLNSVTVSDRLESSALFGGGIKLTRAMMGRLIGWLRANPAGASSAPRSGQPQEVTSRS